MADSLNDPLLKPAAPAADSGGPSATAAASSSPLGASRPRERKASPSEQFNDTVQMVKDYARQETLDPLKIAGRWIGLGLVGSVLIGSATFFLVLGLLRMLQVEFPDTFEGRWMKLLPYLIALVFCAVVALLAKSRINKQPLTKEKR